MFRISKKRGNFSIVFANRIAETFEGKIMRGYNLKSHRTKRRASKPHWEAIFLRGKKRTAISTTKWS